MKIEHSALPPRVSVIIPCYNQGQYLAESVASALMACSHPMEIIIVDDGSTQPHFSRHLCEAAQKAPGVVRIHQQRNRGLSSARNCGVDLARGEFVQFLDADDLLAPKKIEIQIAQLEVNPDLAASVCNYLLCDEGREIFSKPTEAIAGFDLTEHDFLHHWERGLSIPIHCGLFRRSVLSRVRFDMDVHAKEDWIFWTSLAMLKVRFGYVHGHWAIYRQHENSMRRSYLKMGKAWIEAGLKIDSMLAGRDPLFLDAVVSWFDRCYRGHPSYQSEIHALVSPSAENLTTSPSRVDPTSEAGVAEQVKPMAGAILNALEGLPAVRGPVLLSVVIPVYGHFDYLQACLESLARQGSVGFEIICIDDGSADRRIPALLQALQGKISTLRVELGVTNQGISAVQNNAVNLASGEYVVFLDCDDLLEPNALHHVCEALKADPLVDYLFTDRFDIDETGRTIRLARYGGYEHIRFKGQETVADDLMDGMVASHLKVIRRSVYQAVGGSNPKYSGVQDWELALKIAQNYRLRYLPKPLYRHRIHSNSVSREDKVAQTRKTNEVRLAYQQKSTPLGNDPALTHVFKLDDFPSAMGALRAAWYQNGLCVADARGSVNLGQINFLRQFNSYFHRILWSDPQVPASLFGYLHDDSLLRESELTGLGCARDY